MEMEEVEMVQGATEAAALTGRLQCMVKWRGGDEDGDVGEEDRWMKEILNDWNPCTDTRLFCAGAESSGVPPGAAMICRGMGAQTRAYGHQRGWEKLELESVYMYLELGFVDEDGRDALVQSRYLVSIVCVLNSYGYTGST